MSLSVATRAFFAALFRKDASERVEAALRGESGGASQRHLECAAEKTRDSTKTSDGATSSESAQPSALALLAALQREARFVDFVKEPLENCDKALLGLAARSVLDHCATVLERFFEIRPLTSVDEGDEISLDADLARNAARVRVSSNGVGAGNDDADGVVVGRLAHAGWIAKKCATPDWVGRREDAFVLAPMEIDRES